MSRFYVYMHRKPDGTPFYIGKGSGRRARQMDRGHRSFYHHNVIKKYGEANIRVQVFHADSEKEAFEFERYMISLHRINGYRLANMSDGGDGGAAGLKMSEEIKKKLREANVGRKHTKEAKEKMSLSKRTKPRKKHSDETRAKMSQTSKGRKKSEEHRKNISKAKLGKKGAVAGQKRTPQQIENMRAAQVARFQREGVVPMTTTERARKWQAENPEKYRKWRDENRERLLAYSRRRYEENAEAIRERRRKRYAEAKMAGGMA